MKILFATIIASLLFFACTPKTPLQRLIHDADVVKVFVYSGDLTVLHYESNDVGTIQQWKNYIKDDTAVSFGDCPREGRIIFKTSEDSTVMTFSLKERCRYVSYELNGNEYDKSLSKKGIAFIDSLMRVQ
ncbi:MAG: hypothetical protein K1X63_05850 [Chitinophagales bacterium]|nr:hypothetical protein [Chitinophagales bacterium]